MKKIVKKLLIISIACASSIVMLLVASLLFKPLGDVVFSIIAGSRYYKAGETVVNADGKTEVIAIYKAKNKPFLILGPYRFYEGEVYEYTDFFFVNRDQVIRTVTDKGGDAWFRVSKWIFMYDDMTMWDRVRMPYWDDLKCDKNSSVRKNQATDSYIYSFKINNSKTRVTFAIPAKFLTVDMLDAPNDTRED